MLRRTSIKAKLSAGGINITSGCLADNDTNIFVLKNICKEVNPPLTRTLKIHFSDRVIGNNINFSIQARCDFSNSPRFLFRVIHSVDQGILKCDVALQCLVKVIQCVDELIQFINAEYGDTIPRVNMAEVLFEGDWQTGAAPAKADEVIMSTETFDRLFKLFGPKMERTPQVRRPGGTTSTGTSTVRRKPGPTP